MERFRCMVRLRGDRFDFVKAVYDAASWRLALDMRSGFSFEAATKATTCDTYVRRGCQPLRASTGPRRRSAATVRSAGIAGSRSAVTAASAGIAAGARAAGPTAGPAPPGAPR